MASQFLFILFLFCSVTSTKAQTTFDQFGDSLQSWVDQRVHKARKNRTETVIMPLAVRSTGWGCMCPDYYIGVSPGTQEGPFLNIVCDDPTFPLSDSLGYSLIVHGYFDGTIVIQDYRDETGEPEGWLYKTPQFVVTSWEMNTLDYTVSAPVITGRKKNRK